MLNLSNVIIKEDMQRIYNSRKQWDELNNSTVYVTGSTGMLASYVVLFFIYLNEFKGMNIRIIAGMRNIIKGEELYKLYIKKNYFEIYNKDITSKIDTNLKIDYIIHAASLASPQYYGNMPVETILPNIIGTNILLEYAKHNPIKGMLFFSSGDVYGTVVDKEKISEEHIGVLDFLSVGSFYGESKRCGEALCKAYFLEYDVPVKCARIAHTYSPTMDIENDKRVFSEFVSNIIKKQDIIIKSDGSAKRPFCYITDGVAGLFNILLDGESGESYNVGNDKQFVSIKELAEILISIYPERKLGIVYGKRNESNYTSNKEIRSSTVSMDKLRILGWEAMVSINEGFKRVIQYIEHNDE